MVSGEIRVPVAAPTAGYNDHIRGAMDITIESMAATDHRAATLASVQIVEQPTRSKIRFRYKTELATEGCGNTRNAGSIPGANSTADNKTYPTIKILNHTGPAIIYASCVTKDYKAHPHHLVGLNCDKGVFTFKQDVSEQLNEFQLKDVGIMHMKRECVDKSLRDREAQKVDPFCNGFTHTYDSIDMLAVRIAFQVFIQKQDGNFYMLPAVATEVVNDQRARCDLRILHGSHTTSHDAGGVLLFLLCDHIVRSDRVEFYREAAAGGAGWSAEVQPSVVHHCVSAIVPTPPYNCRDYASEGNESIQVKYRLKRKMDDGQVVYSEPITFDYIPNPQDSTKRKFVMKELLNFDGNSLKNLPVPKSTRVSKKADRKERAPKVATLAGSTHREHTGQWQQSFGMLPSTATRSPGWNKTTPHLPAGHSAARQPPSSQPSYTTTPPLQHSSTVHSMQSSSFRTDSLASQSSFSAISLASTADTTTPYFESPYSGWLASQSSLSETTAPPSTMQDQLLSQRSFTAAPSLPHLPQVRPRYSMENMPHMIQQPLQHQLLPDPSTYPSHQNLQLTAPDTSNDSFPMVDDRSLQLPSSDNDLWSNQQQSAVAAEVVTVPTQMIDICQYVDDISDEIRRLL